MAGIVTLTLNSAVWAKSASRSDSQSNFRYSESINEKDNTKTNDNGNIQSNDMGNIRTSNTCDPKYLCQKALDDAMATLNNLFK